MIFQLSYVQWSKESERHEQSSTWNLLSKNMMEYEDFGLALSRENGWMSDELQGIVQHSLSDEEKTIKIYNYIRDNFKTPFHFFYLIDQAAHKIPGKKVIGVLVHVIKTGIG